MAEERIDGDENAAGIAGTVGNGSGDGGESAAGIRTVNPGDGSVKRGRGRPKGSGTKTAPGASAGTGERRVAEPAARKPQKAPQIAVGGIESILYSLHMMASAIVPEAMLDDAESKELAVALAAVNEHYATAIDPKKVAWFALLGVAGKIYGTRVLAFMARQKMEKAMRRPQISPLAGNRPTPAPVPATSPSPRQTVPMNAVPPHVRQTISDPSFVADIGEE